jgi:hypothetical protein
MRGWHRSRIIGIAAISAGLLGVGWAFAEFHPVLHEHFDPDPKEDLELGVRVTAAGLPAALVGQSGPVQLPNPTRPIDRKEPIYAERQAAATNRFRIDRETTDPGRLSYHEPFRPSIAPFKRTHVFDTVNAEFDLAVSDPRLRPMTIAGAPGPGDDQFFANLVLDLIPGEWVRVASAGPHMAVYSAHLEPESPFGFYVDRAENWFVRAPEGRGRARLVMHVGVARAAFDGRIEASSYSALISELPQIPPNVERVASQLLQGIGASRVLSPADALGHLVTYFRGFAESGERPMATQGEGLYRELVTSRKGVCRHRAYAFVVTSLGLGIPARFVHNEAHAWVEVFGGIHWHRIDLGGAASGIDYRGEPPEGPLHRPPAEAYAWPKQAQSAVQSLATGSSQSPGGPPPPQPGPAEGMDSPPKPATSATPVAPNAPNAPPTEQPQLESKPTRASGRGRVIVSHWTPAEVQRGSELGLTGRVETSEGRCGNVRVDAIMVQKSRRSAIGSFATDGDGHFATKLTVPADLPVGRYELVVSTPGSKDCPPASTE